MGNKWTAVQPMINKELPDTWAVMCVYKYRDTNEMNKPFTHFSLTIPARHTKHLTKIYITQAHGQSQCFYV